MSKKRSHFDLDPDYEDVTEQQSKRQRVLEEGAKEATKNKIEAIIRKQFGQEIENKEAEIMNISENLERSRTILDRLRACIVASYYGNANQQKCLQNKASQQTPMIHPTVKKYLGKAPKGLPAGEMKDSENLQAAHQLAKVRPSGEHGTEKIGSLSLEKPSVMTLPCQLSSNSEPVAMTTKVDPNQSDTRSGRFKVKKRIIVGNVSKTIPADRRDENDQATHKWMVYVRGPKESPRIDHFVKKVWFFLHPSYRPNDLVEVSEHPFHLTRRGWGEFPVRVQLHFKDSRNKRLDIIHNLKLDRTYTSLQTLGAETVVDIELERDVSEVKKKTKVAMATGETTVLDSTVAVKQEPVEYNGYLNNTSTLAVSQNHVQVEFDPGGHEYMNKSTRNNQIPEIKLEPTDHDYGISTHGKPLTKSPNVKQEKRSTANLGISGANNNLRLVFSGLGTQGISNVISPQGIQNSVSASISPVKTGLIKQTSPKSQNKGQAVVQLGNALTLQGVGSLSNSGLLISNQQAGKQNLVPVLLGNSPTKISGNQPIFQPGSVLLSTALPASTQVTGSQINSQSGSLVSPSLPLSQSVPQGNQTNNPGLVFLKCTDNQGKTYLIPQQICPTVQTSNNIATPVKGHSAVSNKSANSKVPVSLSGSQIKVPVSAPLVSLSQLTAVGLHPKQAPVQLAGPLIFIKPEEMPKPGSQSKSSPPNLTVNTKSFQTLKLITPPKSQGGININSTEGKYVANQSSMRGQLKVTSQGLITVQNDDASYNKNLVSKTEPTDDSSVKGSSIQVASSVAKQPIIILPHNNKAPVSLQCNPTLLQSSGMKLSSGSTLSNFIIVNASKTSQKLESTCLTNTTPSCGTKSSPAASHQKSGAPKTNMLLLQTKTTGSDKPNHLVIVPVSCASSTVTRPTVSIATMSCSGKSLIVSKALPTVCSTLASFSTTSLSSAASLTSTDKNKTMYIVVEGNTTKERSAQVSDGQRSMTSLLSKVPAPVSSSSTSSGLNNSKQPNVKLIPAQSLLSSSGLISSSSSSSASLLSASSASLLSSSPASLLSTSSSSSSVSASAVPSFYPLDNTIPVTISTSGQKETKVLVVNSNNPVTETPKPWKPDEKKIISLGPKKKKVFKEPEKTIRPLGSPDDYPDLLSLVRAAVLRHPIVNENTAKHLHPYCSVSKESWLSWNVGKRRSSEWQRASSVQKFILSYLNGSESFKGEPLWSVKEILTWCRLHAYSPHYLEKPLHPTGLNLQAESSLATDKNHKFRSLSGYSDVLQEVTTSQKTTEHLDDTDENIDIISTDPPKVNVKTEVKDITESPFVEYLPLSEGAQFVQETSKKIGVKFSPTEVEPGYYGHLSQDFIFSAMESFVGDILRETFALQVNMGRYPDALGVADVYRALSNLPITDFITNKYSGVEDTGGVPTSYR